MVVTDKKSLTPTLPLLKAFYAVATHRSFKDAAKKLNISQPTIVKQISDLENICNAKLFIRERNNNRLNELGLQLMPMCKHVILGIKEIDEFLLSHGKLQHGTLTIAAVSPYHVTQALKDFTLQYPKIKVRVIYGSTAKAKELLASGLVDISLFLNIEPMPGFHAFVCQEYQIMAIIPRSHPLHDKEMLLLSDINNQVFITREQGSTTKAIFEQAMQAHSIMPSNTLEIGSREAVREAVKQGIGISVVTEHEHIEHEDIICRAFDGVDLPTKYSFMVPNERLRSPLIRAFLQSAASELQNPLHL